MCNGSLKCVLGVHKFIAKGLSCDGSHQVEHAAQHGQQQEGSLGVHAVDGAHHRRAGGRHAKDERPDGVQVKLREQDTHTAVIHNTKNLGSLTNRTDLGGAAGAAVAQILLTHSEAMG